MNLHVEQISINLVHMKYNTSYDTKSSKTIVILCELRNEQHFTFTPNCKTQNPWTSFVPNPCASLVPPFFEQKNESFSKSKKVHGVTRRRCHMVGLKRQMLGCIYIYFCQTAQVFTFETLWQLSPQVPIRRRNCRKLTIALHQGQLYTRD